MSNPCYLFNILGNSRPKKLFLSTYTMSREVALGLNAYARHGHVIVCAAKMPPRTTSDELLYHIHVTPWNHSKIWMIDHKVYVGSTNLVADTIVNLMAEIKGAPARRARNLLTSLITRRVHKCVTKLV